MPALPPTSVTLRRAVSALAVMALGVSGLMGLAAPASAANTVTLTVLGGTVGVSQSVQASVASDAVGQPSGTITFTSGSTTIGSAAVGGTLGSTASVTWVPVSAGTVEVKAAFVADDASTVSDTRTVDIAKVGTTVAFTGPGTAATGSSIDLSARVAATQGSYVPTGNVTFYLANSTSLGRARLDSSGVASVKYKAPDTVQTVTYYVVYDGDASASNARSGDASLKITATASTITLTAPATNYVQQPVILTARLAPDTATGRVEFLIGDKVIGSSVISKGVATLSWTPMATGTYTATARFGGSSGVAAGSATTRVVVSTQQKTDVITVDPVGVAAAWKPGGTINLPNGSSTPLTVTAVSKNKVTLSINGPCALSGNALVVRGVGGTCVLSAKTAGGNGYSPVTQAYNVVPGRGTQTAKVVAPESGNYSRGRSLRLGRLAATTNIGKQVTWQVRPKYKRNCRVYTTSKNFKVKLVRPGTCIVVGKAPAVPGQWSQFKVVRTYRIL